MRYYDREQWPAFLAAIRSAPTDDLPRLVCADWLDEHGESERAEFIRVSIECEKCVDTCGHGRVCRTDIADFADFGRPCAILRLRADTLFTTNACRWLHGIALPDVAYRLPWQPTGSEVPDDSYRVQFVRGFQSSAYGPLAVLHGGECDQCHYRGMDLSDGGLLACKKCHGTGRVPGVLPAILRREPVGVVGIEVTDRTPWRNEDGSYSWWMMYHGTSEEPADLHETIWNALEKPDGRSNYPTADAARAALSRALLKLHAPQTHEVSR